MKLKKPLPLYLLAAVFILSPIGNILLSLKFMGFDNWYSPEVLAVWLPRIPLADRVWLSFNFLAGVALLRQSKVTWNLALAALALSIITTIINTILIVRAHEQGVGYLPLAAVFSTLGAGGILYFYRFPYLDRRESWWGMAVRRECSLPASLRGESFIVTDLSETGAFLSCAPASKLGEKFTPGTEAELTMEGLRLRVQIMRVSPTGVGVQFLKLSSEQNSALKKLLRVLPVRRQT